MAAMRRVSAVLVPVVLLGATVSGLSQAPFQRDKVMISRGKTPYVPLDNPVFVDSAQTALLTDEREEVLGLSLAGDARAYPVRMMAWHHVVNDTVGAARRPVALVY